MFVDGFVAMQLHRRDARPVRAEAMGRTIRTAAGACVGTLCLLRNSVYWPGAPVPAPPITGRYSDTTVHRQTPPRPATNLRSVATGAGAMRHFARPARQPALEPIMYRSPKVTLATPGTFSCSVFARDCRNLMLFFYSAMVLGFAGMIALALLR